MKIVKSLPTLVVIILLAIFSEAKPISSILSETESTPGTLDVFGKGNLSTAYFNVRTTSPPRPLLVVTPNVSGTYPVVLFLHGTYLLNSFYTDLLQHLSSHGYIVVAPQLWDLILPSGPEELEYAVKVANWLPLHLTSVLPKNVEANLEKIALAGHSRGGKTAFALALGYSKIASQVKFSAVIGVDPVAGASKESRTEPKILNYVPGSFNLTIPVAVIGTGLGDQPKFWPMPACAPQGVNHVEFFLESRPPSGHFVTTDYGHMDMLNDHLDGVIGTVAEALCKNGKGPKDPMRRTIGGIVVAFLKAYFEADADEYATILEDPSVAPVTLDAVHQFAGPPNHPQPQVNFNYIDGSTEL
ncbi:hypothetical protein K2173_018413 [Erythroxylum novogranatense]|uniref:Chlorophyllase n=1 Tax=Erythroxylum novogranatense TaxID=1862640 RepID=A0AAV8UBN9_9ROSI|nr:hypothetical protein K2173_018413 [Erythroxylum novogranatense]